MYNNYNNYQGNYQGNYQNNQNGFEQSPVQNYNVTYQYRYPQNIPNVSFDYEGEQKKLASQSVRRDFNGIGAFLLISGLAVPLTFSVLLEIFATIIGAIFGNAEASVTDALQYDSFFYWAYSSIVSIIDFFIVSVIYAKIRHLNFNKLFVFEKIKPLKLIALVLFGLSVSVFGNTVANLISNFFSLFGTDAGGNIDSSAQNLPDILIYFVSVALVPALIEEFTFRGVILGSLRKYGDGVAVFVSAAIFGAMHGNFIQIPFAFMLGLAFGYVVVYTNSLLPSIIIHFINNGVSVLFDVMYQNSEAWGITEVQIDVINYTYMIAIALLGIIACAVLAFKDKKFLRFKKTAKSEYPTNKLSYKEIVKLSFVSPTMLIFYIVQIILSVTIILSPLFEELANQMQFYSYG